MKYLITHFTILLFLFSISPIALTNNPSPPNKKNKCQIEVAFEYEVENLTVHFNNASIGAYDQIRWDFGDESDSKEVNPIHTYNKEGMYRFCATAINSDTDCRQEFCAEVYVFE